MQITVALSRAVSFGAARRRSKAPHGSLEKSLRAASHTRTLRFYSLPPLRGAALSRTPLRSPPEVKTTPRRPTGLLLGGSAQAPGEFCFAANSIKHGHHLLCDAPALPDAAFRMKRRRRAGASSRFLSATRRKSNWNLCLSVKDLCLSARGSQKGIEALPAVRQPPSARNLTKPLKNLAGVPISLI